MLRERGGATGCCVEAYGETLGVRLGIVEGAQQSFGAFGERPSGVESSWSAGVPAGEACAPSPTDAGETPAVQEATETHAPGFRLIGLERHETARAFARRKFVQAPERPRVGAREGRGFDQQQMTHERLARAQPFEQKRALGFSVRVLRGDGAGLAEEREDGRDQHARRRPEDGWCVGDGGGGGWHLRGSVRVVWGPPDRLGCVPEILRCTRMRGLIDFEEL